MDMSRGFHTTAYYQKRYTVRCVSTEAGKEKGVRPWTKQRSTIHTTLSGLLTDSLPDG
jgi:hypothetical protein